MSEQLKSELRQSVFSATFAWFLAWLSGYHWSVGASFFALAIFGTLAWWLIKPRILEQKAATSRRSAKWQEARKIDLGALARIISGLVILGAATSVVWSGLERYRVERLEHGLSWRAREFWRAQCLGMKTFQITGAEAKDILRHAPTMSKLPSNAMMDTRRQAVYELQEKGIIRGDIPPEEVAPGVIVQTTETTNLGRTLCSYYLTAYTAPKVAESSQKTQ